MQLNLPGPRRGPAEVARLLRRFIGVLSEVLGCIITQKVSSTYNCPRASKGLLKYPGPKGSDPSRVRKPVLPILRTPL